MDTWIARDIETGLYFGGELGREGFIEPDQDKATVFGDAHRCSTDELESTGREWDAVDILVPHEPL